MKIALIAGSVRTGSINVKLTHAMAQKYAALGDDVTVIDLKQYEMPIYNGDYEAEYGAPQATHDLAALLLKQDGVFMSCPEYNGSLTPLLKNTIDWLTRTGNRDHITSPVWSLGSCTMGPMSGLMVIRQMGYIMNRILADVLPRSLGVGNAAQAFNADSSFAREFDQNNSDAQITELRLRVKQKQTYSATN